MDAHDEKDVVIHSVDGIEEYDNKLPNWWLYTLYGAIVFALGYWFTFHVFKAADLPQAEWRKEVAAAAAAAGKEVPVTPERLVDLSHDGDVVRRGKEIYTTTCVPCHGPSAGGNIGPNLTDEFWLHGGAPDKVYTSVKDGWTTKGMPAWGPQLGGERVEAVVAYLLTLRNTNVPGGKPPQGERELFGQNP